MQAMTKRQRISRSGLDLIKPFEGLRLQSERLANGQWIVGYGHTLSAREGVRITEKDAEDLLRYDLQAIEALVRDETAAPLNQNQFEALVAFAWNIGREAFLQSDVLRYVNEGQMLAAAESFSAWRKARIGEKVIVLDALVRRRCAEKNLFLTHPSGQAPVPTAWIKPECDEAASVLALPKGAANMIVEPVSAVPANDYHAPPERFESEWGAELFAGAQKRAGQRTASAPNTRSFQTWPLSTPSNVYVKA